MLEGRLRADLMGEGSKGDYILPKRIRTEIDLQELDQVQQIVDLLYQEYMPSEQLTRLATVQLVETPLKTATNFQDGSTRLRTWLKNCQALERDFNYKADPLRLYMAVSGVAGQLAREHLVFGQSYVDLLRLTNIEHNCSTESLA
eukprot:5293674-Amphidinium_carterae.1